MQKFLLVGVAILLFAIVVIVAMSNHAVAPSDGDYRVSVPNVVPGVGEVESVEFTGTQYACDNGDNVYVDLYSEGANMTLTYPDGMYGTAPFPDAGEENADGSVVYTNAENVLTLTDTTATFVINDVVVADRCKLTASN